MKARLPAGSVFWMLVVLLSLPACAPLIKRNPVPAEYSESAYIATIPGARHWGDAAPEVSDEEIATYRQYTTRNSNPAGTETIYLAISGGGSNGAFGAGLLNGWTASGTRPQFTFVTGISTGALIAPFAFLGSQYDKVIEEMYTDYGTTDILRKKSIFALVSSDSLYDTQRLKRLIARYMTEEVMTEIAAKHKRGRGLLIGTTNLDANRPVIWRIGRIASSEAPDALDLIRKIMLASASVPGVFPPVYMEVEADGQRYDELHVDGGTSSQVFLYPAQFDYLSFAADIGLATKGHELYIIRNAKLDPQWKSVKPELMPIVARSVQSLIANQGIGDLFRIYQTSRRDGFEFNLARIPADFDLKPTELFDTQYMKALYDTGYKLGETGYPWLKSPPGIVSPRSPGVAISNPTWRNPSSKTRP